MLIKVAFNFEVTPTEFEVLAWYAETLGFSGSEHVRIEALIKNHGTDALSKAAVAKAEHDELWRDDAEHDLPGQ